MFTLLWLIATALLGLGLGWLSFRAHKPMRASASLKLVLWSLGGGILVFLFPGPLVVALLIGRLPPMPLDLLVYIFCFAVGVYWPMTASVTKRSKSTSSEISRT